jgi:thiamine transport system permease protein
MNGSPRSANEHGIMSVNPYNAGRLRRGHAALGAIVLVAGCALLTVLVSGFGSFGSAAPDQLWSVLRFTLLQAALSTLLSVALAIPVAFALDQLGQFRGRRLVLALFALPLSLPAIIGVMALLSLFGRNGLLTHILTAAGLTWTPDIYGLGGILLAHVFFNMPLAIRLITNAAAQIPEAHWKLAETLRFSVPDQFRLLFWPVTRQALAGIAGLVFMLCVTSFAIVLVLGGGPSATTVEVAIYQALTYDFNLGLAAALTLIQLGVVMILLLALNRFRAEPASSLTLTVRRRRYGQLPRAWKGFASALVGLAFLFIAAPVSSIFISGANADHAAILVSPAFSRALFTSLWISVPSAAIACACALAQAYGAYATGAARGDPGIFALAANLSLAFPPLVLGAGWFILASKLGNPYDAAAPVVIAANVLMALPFCIRVLEPAVAASAKRNDRLAQSLGLHGLHKMRLIDLPVLKRPLSMAFVFAMVLSLGDLGVIALFGSDAIQTLPALLFAKMGAYRSADASAIALYLLILTMLLTFLFQFLEGREHQ